MKKKSSQNGQKGSVDKVISSYTAAKIHLLKNSQACADTLMRRNV